MIPMRRALFAGLLLVAAAGLARAQSAQPQSETQTSPATPAGVPSPDPAAEATTVSPAPPAFSPAPMNVAPQRIKGPVRISGGVMTAMVVNRVDPVYPEGAKASGVSGSVVLDAVISKSGTVETLKVMSGPAVLASAATDAVKQWTYRPYQLGGQPVEVRTTVTVNFNVPAPPQ